MRLLLYILILGSLGALLGILIATRLLRITVSGGPIAAELHPDSIWLFYSYSDSYDCFGDVLPRTPAKWGIQVDGGEWSDFGFWQGFKRTDYPRFGLRLIRSPWWSVLLFWMGAVLSLSSSLRRQRRRAGFPVALSLKSHDNPTNHEA
jgi:hypothetical protein